MLGSARVTHADGVLAVALPVVRGCAHVDGVALICNEDNLL